MTIAEGQDAPDFLLPSTRGGISLREMAEEKKVVLAFYQEDSTPACSAEISVLRDDYDFIQELGAEVLAVSADPIESHRDFEERLGGLPFPLASDQRLDAARAFGVVDETGKRCRRAVFVIDKGGRVLQTVHWFQPGNPDQYEAIFRALGLET